MSDITVSLNHNWPENCKIALSFHGFAPNVFLMNLLRSFFPSRGIIILFLYTATIACVLYQLWVTCVFCFVLFHNKEFGIYSISKSSLKNLFLDIYLPLMNNPEEPMAVLLTRSIIISACSNLWPVQYLSSVTASEGDRLGARLENHFSKWWDPCYAFRAIYSFKWTGISRRNALLGGKRPISASVGKPMYNKNIVCFGNF